MLEYYSYGALYCDMNLPAPASAIAVAVANSIAFSAIWRRFPHSNCYGAGSYGADCVAAGAGSWTCLSSRWVSLAS